MKVNKIKKYVALIVSFITLISLIAGFTWSVSTHANAVDKRISLSETQILLNTTALNEDRYSRTLERIEYMELKCSKNTVNCNKSDRDLLRIWRLSLKRLGKQLGYKE